MASLHVPSWAWAATIVVVAAVLAADILTSSRRARPVSIPEAAWWTLATVALAVAFGALLAISAGGTVAGQFFAGWLTEYSLSLDNLLVFFILISRSKVPPHLQGRVLLAGILLALLLRGGVIALGAVALRRFQWVEYLFGAFLIYTAAQVAARRRLGDGATPPPGGSPPGTVRAPPLVPRSRSARLADRLSRGGPVRPLLLLVVALGVTDVLFALDSIPAIFGLTRDPFLVFSANVFALLGLRHLYFLAGGLLSRLVYLPAGIAVVLSFIGVKLIAEALRGDGVTRIGPVPVPAVNAWLSLVIIVVVLGVTALASVTATRRSAREDPAASSPPAEVRPRRWRRGGRPRRPRREPSPSRRWPEP